MAAKAHSGRVLQHSENLTGHRCGRWSQALELAGARPAQVPLVLRGERGLQLRHLAPEHGPGRAGISAHPLGLLGRRGYLRPVHQPAAPRPVAGVATQRFGNWRTLIATQSASLLISASLAALQVSGALTRTWLIAGAVGIGLAYTFALRPYR